jgi:hypothetical protein
MRKDFQEWASRDERQDNQEGNGSGSGEEGESTNHDVKGGVQLMKRSRQLQDPSGEGSFESAAQIVWAVSQKQGLPKRQS